MLRDCYRCGPVSVRVVGAGRSHRLDELVDRALSLFTVPWGDSEGAIHLEFVRPDQVECPLGAPYLTTHRMSVVQDLAGLSAHCDSGARARYVRDCGVWRIGVPPSEDELWTITDVDNLLTLALATAWREAGWVPFHAGLVCRDAGIAAMVCAPSGVGKTTLTLAMLRRGWKTLGDDKLLARISDDGQVEMRALTGTFNLYPHTREWFPDLSGIERFPHCSAWTDKRRVPVEWIRPAAMRDAAAPGQVLKLVRTEDTDTVRVSGLSFDETLSLLMKQTVIPGQREIARHVVRTVSMLARQVCGLEVEVGKGAYFNPRCLDALEETLESHQ